MRVPEDTRVVGKLALSLSKSTRAVNVTDEWSLVWWWVGESSSLSMGGYV